MKRAVVALIIAVSALQVPACTADSTGKGVAVQDAGRRYHLVVSGMT